MDHNASRPQNSVKFLECSHNLRLISQIAEQLVREDQVNTVATDALDQLALEKSFNGDRLQFAGVAREGLSTALRRDLLKQLSRLARDEPLITGLQVRGTTWVKPGVFCDAARVGKSNEGDELTFKGLRD